MTVVRLFAQGGYPMKLFKKSNIVIAYWILIFVYWIAAYKNGDHDSTFNYAYQFFFGLIPLLGGIGGLINARKWGGMRSSLGKALSLLSMGLLTWGLGQMAWSYYVLFANTEIPFPSIADIGYFFALPFWVVGITGLSRATGATHGAQHSKVKQRLTFILPATVAAVSYYLLVVVARDGTLIPTDSGILQVFLSIAYPLGDVLILSLALLIVGLSAGYLGGRYRSAIYTLLAGFAVMYFADFTFAYTTTQETYYNGHWVDLLFPTALALMAYGLNRMEPIVAKRKVVIDAPAPPTDQPQVKPEETPEEAPQDTPQDTEPTPPSPTNNQPTQPV